MIPSFKPKENERSHTKDDRKGICIIDRLDGQHKKPLQLSNQKGISYPYIRTFSSGR